MAETGIQKSFESPGVFWLPEKPDQTVTGQLSFTIDDGPQMSLVGGFALSLIKSFPVVHGVLDNAPCTLFNCSHASSKGSYGGLRQTVLKADLLLVGEHAASLDEPIFTGSNVRFGGLNEWVNFSAINIGAPEAGVIPTPSRFDLITQPSIVVKSNEIGGTVTLCGHHNGRFGHHKIDWEYNSFFEIEFDKPVSIRALHKSIFELQNLFSLLTWTRAPVSYYSALRLVAKEQMNPTGKRWSGLYGHWTVTSQGDKTSSHLLTYLADVFDDLPQIVASWFQSSSAIRTSRNLLTSIARSEGQYLQFMFLALMQTVEATHRSFDSKSYMSEADYKTVCQTLTAAIPKTVSEDHRASLKSRIKFGNELSLRTRFKELFLKVPEKLRPHISNDWAAFVGQAVDMRNAQTHPNTDGTAAEPDLTQMWQACQRIKLLLTIVFLNELGLSFEKIEKIATNVSWRSIIRD
jgi:hypothetical protein